MAKGANNLPRFLRSIPSLLIQGRQLSHGAIFVRGCYVHKPGSDQSAPPIPLPLTACNTGSAIQDSYPAPTIYSYRADSRHYPVTPPIITVDCGPPTAPRNGSVESYTDTAEGSVVFFSCDPGLVPGQRMTAVCTEDGWSPDPADLNCNVPVGLLCIQAVDTTVTSVRCTAVTELVSIMCSFDGAPATNCKWLCGFGFAACDNLL